MNSKALSIAIALLLPSLGIAQERITIEDCYQWARENYPDIQRYELIEKTEDYSLSNINKGWLPQISVNAKASYQSDVTQLPFDSEKISSLIPGFSIPTMSKDQYQATAEIDQKIWDGGKAKSAKGIVRSSADVEKKRLEADLYAVQQRVNQLFFGSLLHSELLKQNRLLQKQLQTNLHRIEAMKANGTANASDQQLLQVELLQAKQKETELSASQEAFLLMLSHLTGREMNASSRLAIPQEAARLSDQINRPELQAMEANKALFQSQEKQLESGLRPQLGLFLQGGYGRPGLNMLDNDFNPFYIAGIRLSWNIGNLYTLKNDRRKIATNTRMMDIQQETFRFNTRLEMLQQQTEIKKLSALKQADEEILRLRTAVRQAAEAKQENGILSTTDLVREITAEDLARQQLATRHIQHIAAVYNHLYLGGTEELNKK